MKIGAKQIFQIQLYMSDFLILETLRVLRHKRTRTSAERRTVETLQLPPVPPSL